MKDILVVDDNKAITELVKLTLESSGYNCTVTNDAETGLELMRSNKFDLILLDLVMPRSSGINILQKLRESGVCPRNVVFLTATSFADAQLESLSKEYGVVECMSKPVPKTKLLEVVAKCTK